MSDLVLAVSEWRLTHWKEEEYTFDSLVAWFRAIYCVLLCILRASPNDTLSCRELESICTIGRANILAFQSLILDQQWCRMTPDSFATAMGRWDMWPRILPHRVSGLLVGWVVEPLTLVASREKVQDVIPSSFPIALLQVWSTIEREFPEPFSVEVLEHDFPDVISGLDTVCDALTGLKELVDRGREHRKVSCVYCSSGSIHADIHGEPLGAIDLNIPAVVLNQEYYEPDHVHVVSLCCS